MIKKPNLPETSKEANRRATHEMRSAHKQKISKALRELKAANYETIAGKCGLDKHAVGRRLSEMERDGIVYNTKIKSNTSKGREAYMYSLSTQPVLSASEIADVIVKNASIKEKKHTETPLYNLFK